MVFLRYYALIPISILLLVNFTLAWKRYKEEEDILWKLPGPIGLAMNNFCVVNAYSFFDVKRNKSDAAIFLRKTSILSFIVHLIVLSTIMIMIYNEYYMDHWISPEFYLNPNCSREWLFWMFALLLAFGVYSLTTILHRSKHLAGLEIDEPKENENNNDGDRNTEENFEKSKLHVTP